MKKVLIMLSLLLTASMVACTSDIGSSTDTDTETETVTETESVTETETVPETESETTAETESESESESETEIDPVDYALYTKKDGYTLLYTSLDEPVPEALPGKNAARIKVAADTFLSDITVTCYKTDTDVASVKFAIWRWNTDYATTVAAEPTYTCTLENPYTQVALADQHLYAWATVEFPALTVGEGEWLYEFYDATGNFRTRLASVRNGGNADVSVKEGYADGQSTKKTVQAHVTYEKYDVTAPLVTPDPNGYTKLGEGKAHVILLSGQSNASGQSVCNLLADHVTPEQMARYQMGYNNVRIYHSVDFANNSTDFVPVKLGQGANAALFGPEVGLADYLSRTYPGETFYIIKASFSGTGIQTHWQSEHGQYKHFVSTVTAGLQKLESAGLDPEIFAMVWMQGESDALNYNHAIEYADSFGDLMNRINTKFESYMAENGFAIVDAVVEEETNWKYSSIVNANKRNYAAASQNRYVVDTLGADINTRHENSDPAHYDSDDMLKLGELFGRGIETVLTNAGYP